MSKALRTHTRLKLAAMGALFFLIGVSLYSNAIYKNGFIYCVKFQFTHSAQDAFECGNHYFGIYGPSGYDVARAEYYFGRATNIDPTLPNEWHQYARTAFLRGDFVAALARINMQFKMRGDELMASYYIRGLIEGYAKDYAAAEKDFKHFLEWDRNNWAARNDLAWIYFAEGKYKEVVTLLHGFATTSKPPNPWLLTTDAMALYNLGDTKDAHTELIQARATAATLTEEDWIHAYPGNDPAIAGKGLAAFRQTIEDDIALVENKLSSH
jgi:tetratricopeptide (TPR) repeat protein